MPYSKSKAVQYQRDLRQKRKEAGLCIRCGGPLTDIRITCAKCARRENGYVQNIVQKHLADGKCRCGGSVVQSKHACVRCLDWSAKVVRDLKMQVLAGYGNKCACCGIVQWEFLSVDHVRNDGAQERRQNPKRRSNSFYRMIIQENFPPRYQILCFNCNLSKGLFEYCPHQKG